MSEFSYTDLNHALERMNIVASAAECHGAMSAAICVNGESGYAIWLGSHLPELEKALTTGDALASALSDLTTQLYARVVKQLKNGEFTYALFLPEEDVELEQRVEAMAHWCQGFLLGLEFSGITDFSHFKGELGEIIQDITEISQVSVGQLDYSEEEEQSLTELVEYLRVGVMLFNETLQAQMSQTSKSVH